MYISIDEYITPSQIGATLNNVNDIKIIFLPTTFRIGKMYMDDLFKVLSCQKLRVMTRHADQWRVELQNHSRLTMLSRQHLSCLLCGERADIVVTDKAFNEEEMNTIARPLISAKNPYESHLKPCGIFMIRASQQQHQWPLKSKSQQAA